MLSLRPSLMLRLLSLLWCIAIASATQGQEVEREGDWVITYDEEHHGRVKTMEMTLTPQAASQPALKYRLIPSEYDQLDGNAAVLYLKALGFVDRDADRMKIRDFIIENQKKAREAGQASNPPPYAWLDMAPRDLPVEEVRNYLQWTEFQVPILKEAAIRMSFDMDRRLREIANPINADLSDIQQMRELSRSLKLRGLLAIRENRLEDAFLCLQLQVALARHLGIDEVYIGNLIGCAIFSMAWDNALYFVQHPDAPNLYWALAALPDPLISMERANGFERQFLFEQVKVLKEVSTEPLPAGYWQDFLERLLPQIEGITDSSSAIPDFQAWKASAEKADRLAALAAFVAEAYPGARQYLVDVQGFSLEQIEAYPTAQTVFLALKLFYEQWRDEVFKWNALPAEQWEVNPDRKTVEQRMGEAVRKYGPAAEAATMLLPAIMQMREAQLRVQQKIVLLQTVEAIRMYGAQHDGALPATLEDLPVPAPLEPYTGRPFQYEVKDDQAVLSAVWRTGIQWRLSLKFAGK